MMKAFHFRSLPKTNKRTVCTLQISGKTEIYEVMLDLLQTFR